MGIEQSCLMPNATCQPQHEPTRLMANELRWSDAGGMLPAPCCEGECFVPLDQREGFCQWKTCIDDGESCFANATSGYCCSGSCAHFQGEPNGTCNDSTSPNTPPPLVYIPLPEDGIPQPHTDQDPSAPYIYGIIGAGAGLVLLVVLGVAVWWHWRRITGGKFKFRARARALPLATYVHLKPLLSDACNKFEVDKKDFRVDFSAAGVLGSGEFGVVLKGRVRGVPVAAKTVSPSAVSECQGAAQWMALLQELKVRVHAGLHENVMALIGSHTQRLRQGVCFVFVELCSNGNLEDYVAAHRHTFPGPQSAPCEYVDMPPTGREIGHISHKHLRLWSSDISAGMAHLASLRIVHSDLATRNVLVSDTLVAKIGDFGLSQRVYDAYRGYVTGNANTGSRARIPWQHMAPEALTRLKFSEQSDVWAFGVTMWQLYTLGVKPLYAPLEWTQDFAQLLVNGTRLEQPEHASNEVYELMSACWALEPSQRLTFEELHGALQEI